MKNNWSFWSWLLFYLVVTSIGHWQLGLDLIWWWLGGFLGAGVLWADRLGYVYWVRPHEQLSVQVKHLIENRRFQEAVRLLMARAEEQQQLVSLSLLFMTVWVMLAVYVVTSVGSFVATGMVMTTGLRWVIMIGERWGQPKILKQKLFWQIKRQVTDGEMRAVAALYLFVFIWLSLGAI
jgi:uncharacterized membrane protein